MGAWAIMFLYYLKVKHWQFGIFNFHLAYKFHFIFKNEKNKS